MNPYIDNVDNDDFWLKDSRKGENNKVIFNNKEGKGNYKENDAKSSKYCHSKDICNSDLVPSYLINLCFCLCFSFSGGTSKIISENFMHFKYPKKRFISKFRSHS